MFTQYDDAINWIHDRLKFGVKPGLKRMEWLLNKLDHPEKNIPTIHVAGTNGKGSTISYMLHMLMEAGYKVGTFTSPYIETFNERISVNGQPITDDEMLSLVNEIKPYAEKIENTDLGSPTEFEIITTMMFLYFGKVNKPDFLLLETGLGGRLDSTNVIDPILSVITNIGYDHMNILGDTITDIAREKAGIIKKGRPIFTAAEKEDALEVLSQTAKEKHAPYYSFGKDISVKNLSPWEHGEKFSVKTETNTYEDVKIKMRGNHQIKNAALAISVIDYLKEQGAVKITYDEVMKGIKKSMWKGRFELIHQDPVVIVDGAHNDEGIESLIDTIKRHYSHTRIHILFSALSDKNYKKMIDRLSTVATTMHFTTFDFPRAETAINLFSSCSISNKSYSESWRDKFEELLLTYKGQKEDVLIVTGSLYFISEIRNYLIMKKTNM
ncbi:folylpolyglutamate synthase/dihydrofolate synthase family protein [Metabacillus halosaccharovorans]|uniref:bifunctional folylpolyglutamate synthase/dihydrofolate synthase n=1 Tax=Metabacillus halosaccharovorans TaxID=930124 RepID=UPI00203C5CE8|nr:folylpolyglutamate synthase/dihydrofolate synthase family protein [Metabacillus halosaccharovorans]MCM3441950.1 bifunctional folylpolyglutamate synthase/dihydrofolate synthase [Metabacillus halosaccharovorans]